MAARTLGWAQQRIQSVGVRVGGINATTDTAVDPTAYNTQASDRAANVWQVTAGQSVSVRWGGFLDDTNFGGVAGNSIEWRLRVYYETSANLWETAATDSFTQAYPGADWTLDRTLTFTPTSTGTVRIYVEAHVYVTATSSTVARINSDNGNTWGGSTQTYPGVTVIEDFTPGLVRCGPALSSLTPSGFTSPASYPDTVSLAFVTSHAPRFADGTYTVSWRSAADVEFQSSTIAAGTVTALPAVTDAVDDSWPASSNAIRVRLTPSNSGLSTALSGAALPWVHFASVPSSPGTVTHDTTTQVVTFAGAFTADARLTAQHHFQEDTSTFDTSLNDTSKSMLSSQYGAVATRIKNARGEGQNGLTVTQTVTQTVLGTTNSSSSTTATLDSEAGWTTLLEVCPSGKPGGTWAKTVDVTAPAAIDANTHLLTPTDSITVVSANPSYRLVCGGGPGSASIDSRHFTPGLDFIVGIAVVDMAIDQVLTLDTSPLAPKALIGRLNLTLGRIEYLDSDEVTWQPANAATVYAHPLTVSPGDSKVWTKTFAGANTAGWGYADIFIVGRCTVGGIPVNDFSKEIVVNGVNNHTSYSFDAAGLALSGVLTFR